jgi:hypothetical protein
MPPTPNKSLEELDRYVVQDESKNTRRNQMILSVVAVGVLLAAMMGIIYGVLEMRKFTNNGQWPTTEGTVIDGFIMRTRAGGMTEYCLWLTFEYTVGGRVYSQNLELDPCYGTEGDAENAADRIAGGTQTLWYDPTNPERVSDTRVGFEFSILVFVASGVVLLLGLLVLSMAMQYGGEKPKAKPA